MTTHVAPLRSADDVDALVAERWWTPRSGDVERVGLEAECFAIRLAADGAPAGRVPVVELVPLLDAALGGRATREPGTTCWRDVHGGAVTLEPGGQVEYATPPLASPSATLADLERRLGALAAALAPRGVVLASAGLDVWHPLSAVPQQLTEPRYRAMASSFAARGGPLGPGATMMRHTCSLQVNLDLGPPGVAEERWLVAHLAAPVVSGTFAAAPTARTGSGRAAAWRALDPTRTGTPAGVTTGAGPVAATGAHLRSADVLLRRTADGGAVPGRPGWAFGEWLRDGDDRGARPTPDDLVYHATTVWPEVRLRGFLELRGVDALPARWRAVPVVLLAGLLLDDRARGRARAVLDRHRPALGALAERFVDDGVADPALCALAVETWSFALEGARRLLVGDDPAVSARDLATAEAFLDRFTLRGRCPADELRERLAVSPAAALAWAVDPTDVPALVR